MCAQKNIIFETKIANITNIGLNIWTDAIELSHIFLDNTQLEKFCLKSSCFWKDLSFKFVTHCLKNYNNLEKYKEKPFIIYKLL